jgi:hypothetical protein
MTLEGEGGLRVQCAHWFADWRIGTAGSTAAGESREGCRDDEDCMQRSSAEWDHQDRLVAGDFGGEDADVVDAAVALGVVHAVADDELVGDLEGYVVGFDGDEAALRFVEAGGDLE